MYLKGSRLSLNKKRHKPNGLLIFFLVVGIGLLLYFNLVVVPVMDPPFVPTPTPTREPASYVEEADTLAAEGKYFQAAEAYQGAINVDPQNVQNYLKIARLQIYTNQLAQAQVNAQNAILLDNSASDAYALLGWAKGFQRDYLSGEVDAQKAIELNMNSGLAHAAYAYILALRVEAGMDELGTMDKAIEESRTAVALEPNLLEAHWARGYVLEITSNYEEAVEELEIAVGLNPHIARVYMALGRNQINTDQLDQAVFNFTKAYSLNPTDPTPNLFISRIYGMLGEWEKGIQYGNAALRDGPDDPSLYANLGTLYYRKGEFNRATNYLELAVRGGTNEDGVAVEGIPLSYDLTTIETYSRYGLAMAKINRCTGAVTIANALLSTVADNDNAVFNANEILKICEENLLNPPTATPAPTPTNVTGPTATPQP
ncbi:MAG: hypothetical protein WDA04_05140 [Anaerolineaceae bacterium]